MLAQGIFSPQWQYFARPIVDAQKRGTITITTFPAGSQGWDFTNGVPLSSGTVLYNGSAAWERVMRPRRREFVDDAADTQTMRVTIPIQPTRLAFASGQQVVVTACPDNPQDVGLKMYIAAWAGGSNDWEISLSCTTNAKQV